ncbi:peptidylprolyl isomerase [Oricola thermophila]|uniref:Parvulin-like PPIase n=2 Tax=Oricola thermophila TaxID=2742145 RepID=A0A6N1VMK4_9HYPH|nr:peptidylprolyl isomerase [Oricola thermophila]
MQFSSLLRSRSAVPAMPAVRRAVMALATIGAIALPAAAQDETNKVVGTLNGAPITERDLAMTLGDLQDQFGQVPPEDRRAAALAALIDIRALAAKAEAAGLDKTEEFIDRLAFLRERALHNAYFRDEVVNKITDEDVRARYDKEVAATPPQNEVHARHILLETEDEAKAVIEELDNGGDFEALAKEHSTGPTGPNGGDLGYFTRGRMVPEFEEAAFALDVGAHTTEPVQTQFGWHVIKVEDKRQVQPPAFSEVENQIRSVLLRERYFEVLSELREAAEIEITDPDLKEAYERAQASQQSAQ